MRTILLTTALVLLSATPALALKITNLDTVPHTVELSGRGTVARYVIQPDATENLTGATQGFLALISAQNPKPSRGTLHADGMLSGILGAARTEGIAADPEYNYVIWPGGQLQIQSHTKAALSR